MTINIDLTELMLPTNSQTYGLLKKYLKIGDNTSINIIYDAFRPKKKQTIIGPTIQNVTGNFKASEAGIGLKKTTKLYGIQKIQLQSNWTTCQKVTQN